MTHNSYSYLPNVAANQVCPISSQLDDGVRGLKLSAVRPSNSSPSPPNVIHLCHTSCLLLDIGPANNTLAGIAQWVKNNPNEVITIMWNNLGDFKVADFVAAYEGTGLLEYAHFQTWQNWTWPTLQEMIASGKRVVNFLDEGSDQTTVPWLMAEFGYAFETPYNNVNESSFSCVIDRPQSPPNPTGIMYVMNHFLYRSIDLSGIPIEFPQKGTASITNSDSLLKQARECSTTFGRQPNFLEVDFYNRGETLQIAAQLNNVTYQDKGSVCNRTIVQSGAGGDPTSVASPSTGISWTAIIIMVGFVVIFL
ncbi:hypothetical protein EC973_005803 [Apophysomyces ossiformis]|uniref:PLC-like phosphodiesterase n=1 Tax=Apophysomyces ossiformis TaxID=679940 RepID=A0A8H7EQS9_9FUNG|nr:hypothetical protein EC973_005803 [Apophysomyces ossiformis]